MVRLRLRDKLLVSTLLISSGLTCATLLIVSHTVQVQVRKQILTDLRNSVLTFQNVQRQRELTLERSAQLLADLPDLKALMTTGDAATIQDASGDLWRMSGSDLFALANRTGKIVALHTSEPSLNRAAAQNSIARSLEEQASTHWWFGEGRLYEVFLQPIYFGPPARDEQLGMLAVGYKIDDRVITDLSRVANSEVLFRYGTLVVASTLSSIHQAELAREMTQSLDRDVLGSPDIQLGAERFVTTSSELNPGRTPAVRLSVLKSYDLATAFLDRLNHLLIALGLVAVLGGTALVFLTSRTVTRPLENLVAGVRALEKGNFAYPLETHATDEVAELTTTFDRMRRSLQKTQLQLVDSERLATIGRMASSISHDLRHSLTAVITNAEFLCEKNLEPADREDLYHDIRVAVNQMTDLIDSLLEFSKTRESLRPIYGSLKETIERAIQNIRAHPEFQKVPITVSVSGRPDGWFDPKKLERVFYNLLRNACEAVPADTGTIEVTMREVSGVAEILVLDNGPGIPEAIRDKLFQPFVSHGKENGTGLGLAIAQKILQDHGGGIALESSETGRIVFRLTVPLVTLSHPQHKTLPEANAIASLASVRRSE